MVRVPALARYFGPFEYRLYGPLERLVVTVKNPDASVKESKLTGLPATHRVRVIGSCCEALGWGSGPCHVTWPTIIPSGAGVGVAVPVEVDVFVGVLVRVSVGVAVGVAVWVRVGCAVPVGVAVGAAAHSTGLSVICKPVWGAVPQEN